MNDLQYFSYYYNDPDIPLIQADSNLIANSITDMDHHPYKRWFRGEYKSTTPIVHSRKAGVRKLRNQLYDHGRITIDYFDMYPLHEFQYPNNTFFPRRSNAMLDKCCENSLLNCVDRSDSIAKMETNMGLIQNMAPSPPPQQQQQQQQQQNNKEHFQFQTQNPQFRNLQLVPLETTPRRNGGYNYVFKSAKYPDVYYGGCTYEEHPDFIPQLDFP